jgi:hypothetical protein
MTDYSVIGDKVNLGALLDRLTRQDNNHIIILEYTCGRVACGNYLTREVA